MDVRGIKGLGAVGWRREIPRSSWLQERPFDSLRGLRARILIGCSFFKERWDAEQQPA